MKFSDLKSTILEQFKTTHEVVPFIVGKPGGGKSSCAREIAQVLADTHKIPSERIIEFNPSLREPCDVLGLPQFHGECTKWLPPEEFWALRQGVGPCVLILEELSDADMNMQNPLCRVVLARCAARFAQASRTNPALKADFVSEDVPAALSTRVVIRLCEILTQLLAGSCSPEQSLSRAVRLAIGSALNDRACLTLLEMAAFHFAPLLETLHSSTAANRRRRNVRPKIG